MACAAGGLRLAVSAARTPEEKMMRTKSIGGATISRGAWRVLLLAISSGACPATAWAASGQTAGQVGHAVTDSDRDGLTDEVEAKLGTNPTNPDSDGDGLGDGEEVLLWLTDPLEVDTDD